MKNVMKYAAMIMFIMIGSNMNSQTVDWFKRYENILYTLAIAPGPSGDLITCPVFSSSQTNFDTYTLTGTGLFNFAISRIDPSGNGSLLRQFNGNSQIEGISITTDPTGNIFCAGGFVGTAVFDTYTITSPTSSGNHFIFKMNNSGNIQWIDTLNNSTSQKGFRHISTDQSGNIYGIGEFSTSITIGSLSLASSGGMDAFIVKYNSGGTPQWLKKMGGSGNETGYGISIDQTGNIYAIGSFSGMCTFGPYFLNSTGNTDGYICKYNPSGNVMWCKKYGGTNADQLKLTCNTYTNSLYVSGLYTNTTLIGATTLSTSAVNPSNYICKLDTAGNVIWVNQFGTSQVNWANITGITCDASNAVYSTGTFQGMVCYGSTSLSAACLSTPFLTSNSFISKLNSSGNYVWVKQISSTDNYGGSIIEKNDKIFSSGYFNNSTLTIDSYSISGGNNSNYFVKMASAPIGLKENAIIDNVIIYPNPIQNNGKIIIEGIEKLNSKKATISNLLGQTVFEGIVHDSEISLANSNLSQGVYFLQVYSDSQIILSRKIIIK